MGFSHLFSGYPKSGKTTLLAAQVLAWGEAGNKVLYVTEEPEMAWLERVKNLPRNWGNVNFIYGLGHSREELLQYIGEGAEEVVILDTLRLWQLTNENDNSEINIALTPLIAICRNQEKTLIIAHHTNKMGGEYGAAAAGGHALLGIVDIGLELQRDGTSPKRRKIRGWGRIIEVPELVYEFTDEGLTPLGDPAEVQLEQLKERIREVITEELQKTDDLKDAMGEPKPSTPQFLKALDAMARTGELDRDPPIELGCKRGKTYKWRSNLTFNTPSLYVKSEVEEYANHETKKGVKNV